MDYQLLLSDEEYQAKFKNSHPTPYIFEAYGKKQTLFYFGAKHSRNPLDDQWEKLEHFWKKFIDTAKEKTVIFLEGPGGFDVSNMSKDESINKFGESGFLMHLAKPKNSPIIWPDLSIKQEAEQLSLQFNPDYVKYFIFARSAGAWLKSGTMGTFDEIIEKAINSTNQRTSGAPKDFEFYSSIHTQIFGKKLTPAEQNTIITATAPVYHNSIINDIARASSRLRNEHIVSEIENEWLKGNNIFILFGSAHAVVQEKAIMSVVESEQ